MAISNLARFLVGEWWALLFWFGVALILGYLSSSWTSPVALLGSMLWLPTAYLIAVYARLQHPWTSGYALIVVVTIIVLVFVIVPVIGAVAGRHIRAIAGPPRFGCQKSTLADIPKEHAS